MWDKWRGSKLNCYFPELINDKNKLLTEILQKNQLYRNSIVYLDDPTGKTEREYEINTNFSRQYCQSN